MTHACAGQVDHVKQQQHWKLVEAARVIYSAGFFITVSPESILSVAKHCTEQGKIYCMNLSAPFISEVRPSLIGCCVILTGHGGGDLQGLGKNVVYAGIL